MQKSTSMDSSRYCDFLRANLPEWKDLSNDAIDFSLFSSITNKVYKVTPKTQGITPEAVILRKFCGEEGIVDLEKEAQVFQGMSECGAGPKFFAHEGDLRIEEFIPARIILAHEYKQKAFRRKLARATAAMHKIEIAGLDKETLFEHALKKPSYFGYFDKKCAQDIFTPEEKKIIEKVKHVSSREEQEFIREILPTEDQVLSHNDMLEGNVLVIEGTDDIRFIDYEYASYNFRGYDIGNMFREAIYDYTFSEQPYFKVVEENYPNEEELRDYIRYYIVFTDMNEKELEKSDDLINNDESMKSYLEQKYKAEEMKTREDKLYREAKIGSMLSFYYWMVWAVKMFQTNDAQFDYLDFASDNYDHYMKLKAEITADKKK